MVKFGHEYAEEGDNLIVIPEEEGEINLRPPGERAATAHPLTAVPPYGCGVPDAGKRSAQKEGNQRNTGVANTESAAARDRKTEADRGRPYTLILVGTSPRESTAKSLRHSAAPAGMPS